MRLPGRVRVGIATMVFLFLLDTLISAVISFGPPVAIFLFLHPGNFGEKLICLIFSGVVWCVTTFFAAMFWVWFISETAGL